MQVSTSIGENFQLAVAQLVEWFAHMQEVPGSSPGPDLSLTTCELDQVRLVLGHVNGLHAYNPVVFLTINIIHITGVLIITQNILRI